MKKAIKILLIVVVVALLAITGHVFYLKSLAAKEVYPDDTYLAKEPDKKALIIVAHDDDMIGSSGTISMLCDGGWQIREMCFYQQGGLYLKKDSLKNPVRKKDLQTVARLQGVKEVFPIDFNFRRDMSAEKSYMPIPYSQFGNSFMMDSLEKYIGGYIEKYKPTVIFTLDNIIGGYGHPDHVLISQVVLAYCNKHKDEEGFSVKKIYQPVFPPSLAENIFGSLPVYQEAKKVYAAPGMPNPDVQVNITRYGALKKKALASYSTEQNSIRKFWPYYYWYPSWIYFSIFDRDFFRVITIGK